MSSTISIGGRSYIGKNLKVTGSGIFIDGVKIDDEVCKIPDITVHGNVDKLETEGSLTVNGDVDFVQTINGDVKVSGNIKGNVTTSTGNVTATGFVGSVKTTCGSVYHK